MNLNAHGFVHGEGSLAPDCCYSFAKDQKIFLVIQRWDNAPVYFWIASVHSKRVLLPQVPWELGVAVLDDCVAVVEESLPDGVRPERVALHFVPSAWVVKEGDCGLVCYLGCCRHCGFGSDSREYSSDHPDEGAEVPLTQQPFLA